MNANKSNAAPLVASLNGQAENLSTYLEQIQHVFDLTVGQPHHVNSYDYPVFMTIDDMLKHLRGEIQHLIAAISQAPAPETQPQPVKIYHVTPDDLDLVYDLQALNKSIFSWALEQKALASHSINDVDSGDIVSLSSMAINAAQTLAGRINGRMGGVA